MPRKKVKKKVMIRGYRDWVRNRIAYLRDHFFMNAWEITICWMTVEKPGSPDAGAEVVVDTNYLNAHVTMFPMSERMWVKEDLDTLGFFLIHEMSHALMDPLLIHAKDATPPIAQTWSRLVQEQDMVIHLGDVILGMNGTLKDILDCLPGRKVLVRGNHDHESGDWYMRNGFIYACQGILYGGVWFSHAPSLTLPTGAKLNVHGHLHDSDHHGTNIPEHCKLLSLERTGYCPVEFEDFVGFPPSRKVDVGNYF